MGYRPLERGQRRFAAISIQRPVTTTHGDNEAAGL